MPRGRNDDKRVRQEDPVLEFDVLWRARHHVEVVEIRTKPLHHPITVQHLQRHVDTGVFRAETAQPARDEILRGADHRQREAPALETPRRIRHLPEALPLGLHPTGGLRELLSQCGQSHPAGDHLVERQPDGLRECSQLHGRGGLRDVQGSGCGTDAAGVGEREEKAQLSEARLHAGSREAEIGVMLIHRFNTIIDDLKIDFY